MSNEIDWSKAPEGAMCYVHEFGFFKCEHGEWWVSQGAVWQRTPYSSPENFSWFGNVVWRGKEWNGTGLPPVGTVCEVDYCEHWHQCEVIAHFQQRVGMVAAFTVDMGDGVKALDAFGAEYFRPIRTPEQIAAEERGNAVNEMLDNFRLGEDKQEILRAICFGLYDAGYRKTEVAK